MKRFLILCVILIMPLVGCETLQQDDQLVGVARDVQAEMEALRATIAALPDESDIKVSVEEMLAKAQPIAVGVSKVAEVAASGEDPGPAIQETGAGIAAVLPPPWNSIVLLGTTVLGALGTWKYRRSTAAGREIVRAIEKTGALDPTKKCELASAMTDDGKRFVEEVTK